MALRLSLAPHPPEKSADPKYNSDPKVTKFWDWRNEREIIYYDLVSYLSNSVP